jgi:hypothetical protein
MRQASRFILLSSAAAVLLSFGSGCAVNRATANRIGDANLGKVKKIYVGKLAPDKRNLNTMIMEQFIKNGYEATTGPENEIPAGVDAVATYRDKWMWDITNYMLELTITLREPGTQMQLAVGNSYHTSLTRKSPEGMVTEVVTNLVKEMKKGS